MKKNILGKIIILLVITLMLLPLTGAVNDSTIIDIKNKYNLDERNHFTDEGRFISSWIERAKLTASDGEDNDFFGCSVAFSGDYALIGSYQDDSFMGSVYVFKYDDTIWRQHQKLRASDAAPWTGFGEFVSMHGNYAIISSTMGNDNIGCAYIFKLTDDTWEEEQILTPTDGVIDDGFGQSITIYGNYALIAAPYDDDMNGSVYIFKRDGIVWTEEDKLTSTDPGTKFGHSVSLYSKSKEMIYLLLSRHCVYQDGLLT